MSSEVFKSDNPKVTLLNIEQMNTYTFRTFSSCHHKFGENRRHIEPPQEDLHCLQTSYNLNTMRTKQQ